RCRCIFGELAAERGDATPSIEVGAAPEHGFALRETEANGISGVLPAPLIGVEKAAFDLCPEASWCRANWWCTHQAGIRGKMRQQSFDIVWRQQQIAVGQD